jgi:cellulose synthase/poly-beta-1,6-N-acetylglucosamine synthase-like glycosyltransferase
VTPPQPIAVQPVEGDAARSAANRCLSMVPAELTARRRLSRAQAVALVGVLLGVVIGGILAPWPTAIVLTGVATLTYAVTLIERVRAFSGSMTDDPTVHITDEAARSVPDHELPIYTVLIPLYREPEVIAELVEAMARLEYPRDRLEIRLLLEDDDDVTLAASHSILTDLPIKVLVVPPGNPRTKPRALNYGMQFTRGELITVYDAEDRPEPLQLRRAAAAMRKLPDDFACLQARLEFFGSDRGLLARWFCLEYLTWFRCLLPGMASRQGVMPLGGTSNHFRRSALVRTGGWDPYNVTEDADLGIRLERQGYEIGILDSVTMEEVNSDLVNWVKQRSRWQKGYLQTALVHLRSGRRSESRLTWRSLMHLVLFIAGTPILALCNLLFWTLTLLWLVFKAHFIESLFPGSLFYVATGVWLLGNFTIAYLSVLTVRITGRHDLLGPALISPIYWILMSIAGVRAVTQLITDPFHWEKTHHGLGASIGTKPGPGTVAAGPAAAP